MKFKNTLLLFVALAITFSSLFLGLTYKSFNDMEQSLKTAAKKTSEYTALLNEIKLSQVAFQVQLYQFKSLLIQGNDPEKFDLRLQRYQLKSDEVDTLLLSIKDKMQHLDLDYQLVDKTLENHKDMNTKYKLGLEQFDKADAESGKKVDVIVRDVYDPTFAAYTKLSEYIGQEVAFKVKKESQEQVNKSQSVFYILLTVLLINMVGSILSSVYLFRQVLKTIGAEPEDIKEHFSKLSDGDFSNNFQTKENDEDSLAAKLSIMQLRIKSLVKNLKKGTSEIESLSKNIGIESSTEEVRGTFSKMKQVVNSLSNASNKFKV